MPELMKPPLSAMCQNCFYWDEKPRRTPDANQSLGECRRHAPVLTVDEGGRVRRAVWPTTREFDWCGDGLSYNYMDFSGEGDADTPEEA